MNGLGGAPVSSGEAANAVLALVRSPLLAGKVDTCPGVTIMRLREQDPETGRSTYDQLSKGEQRLVDIAHGIWSPGSGARLDAIGGLDHEKRTKVLLVLLHLFLDHDDRVALGDMPSGELYQVLFGAPS